jgi:DNA-binding PadR family transcriptional regulator
LIADQGLESLDKVLEHRVRLGIAVLLTRYDEISFARFKELLRETDGSLGAQLRKLEDEGYLSMRKEFRERRPTTWYALTPKGRQALASHLQALRQLIHIAEESQPEKERGIGVSPDF